MEDLKWLNIKWAAYRVEIIADSLEFGQHWQDEKKRLSAARILRRIVRDLLAMNNDKEQ